MKGNLVHRLQDIPGVAAVVVDLDDSGERINLRLEPDADEAVVLEKVRSLLVAYGVRNPAFPRLRGNGPFARPQRYDVEVRVTPTREGARVEVRGEKVTSSRLVGASPHAIAQGIVDAWCQVAGRAPVEVTDVSLAPGRVLWVTVSGGGTSRTGRARVDSDWVKALTRAVGEALALDPSHDSTSSLAGSAW